MIKIPNKPKHILTVLLVVTSNFSYAQDKASASLNIQPDTCIVNFQGDECQLDVQTTWTSNQDISCCIYINDNQHSCWQQQDKGEKKLHLEVTDSVQINLVSSHNKVTLASKELSIQAQKTKRYRRRLKLPWSVF